MARRFDIVTDMTDSPYLQVDSSPLTAYPFTMMVWFYPTQATVNEGLFGLYLSTNAANPRCLLAYQGATAGDPVVMQTRNTQLPISASAPTLNAWNCAIGVWADQDDRRLYLNNVKSTSVVLQGSNMTALNRVGVSGYQDSTPDLPFTGAMAWATIWTASLTDDDAAILSAGYHPFFVNPTARVFFLPMGGFDSANADDRDLTGGLQLTAFNSPTTQDHPGGLVYPHRLSPTKTTPSTGTVNPFSMGGVNLLTGKV